MQLYYQSDAYQEEQARINKGGTTSYTSLESVSSKDTDFSWLDSFGTNLKKTFSDIAQTLKTSDLSAGNVVSKASSSLVSTATSNTGNMGSLLSSIVQYGGPLGVILWGLQKVFSGIIEVLEPVVNNILDPLAGMLTVVGKVIGGLLTPALKILEPVMEFIGELFVWVYNDIIVPVYNAINEAFNTIYNGFVSFINGIIDLINKIPFVKDISHVSGTTSTSDGDLCNHRLRGPYRRGNGVLVLIVGFVGVVHGTRDTQYQQLPLRDLRDGRRLRRPRHERRQSFPCRVRNLGVLVMAPYYKITISYDNSTWTDISDYIVQRSVTMTYSLHGSDSLECNTNSAKFTLLGYKALLDTLLTSTDPVYCKILRDGEAFISGIISPVTKVTPSHSRITATELTVEDFTLSKLKKRITSTINWSDYAVCNPDATASSIVHQLLSLAGVEAASYPTITTTIPYLCVVADDKKTYFDILEAVLFEAGYLFYFGRAGKLVFYNLADCPSSYSSITNEFLNEIGNDASNIMALENATKRGSYDEIKLTWYGKEKKEGLTVFEDTTGATTVHDCVIEVEAGDFYPDKETASGTVYSEYKNDSWTILNVLTATLTETDTGLYPRRRVPELWEEMSLLV